MDLHGWFTIQNALYFGGLILAALLGTILKHNAIAKALDELGKAVYNGIDKSSPGGKKLTKVEKEKIMREALDVIAAIIKSRFKFWKFWKAK